MKEAAGKARLLIYSICGQGGRKTGTVGRRAFIFCSLLRGDKETERKKVTLLSLVPILEKADCQSLTGASIFPEVVAMTQYFIQ